MLLRRYGKSSLKEAPAPKKAGVSEGDSVATSQQTEDKPKKKKTKKEEKHD